jgi:hypothetical protein
VAFAPQTAFECVGNRAAGPPELDGSASRHDLAQQFSSFRRVSGARNLGVDLRAADFLLGLMVIN